MLVKKVVTKVANPVMDTDIIAITAAASIIKLCNIFFYTKLSLKLLNDVALISLSTIDLYI
jgi:hypothetical protein